MKEVVWATPNRMVFKSGHKAFDRRADYIAPGNCIGGCQFSSYIRPYSETQCNGLSRPPGHLRDFDLEPFKRLGIPDHVLKAVLSCTTTESIILYQIRHTVARRDPYSGATRRRIIHGYIITDTQYNLIASFVTGPTYKSEWVIKEAIEYLSNSDGGESESENF